jgi:tetratricopeptide (TPR) repeat protein
MKRTPQFLAAAAAVILLGVASTGCKKLEARDNLNKGVQAFKNAKYADAVQFFQKSIELDPTFPTARLYLATAYMSQYIPGAESPDNNKMAASAMEEFKKVLDADPKNATAIESIASLFYMQAQGAPELAEKIRRLDSAKEWYQKLTEADPSKKEAWYSLGVITWAKWYPDWMAARSKAGMKPEDPGPIKDKKIRADLNDKYRAMLDQAIKDLEKSLEIDPEYDDAMAYMNLLIRERADLYDSNSEYETEVKKADDWMQKALDTRKIKAERLSKKAAGGIISEGADEKE